MKDFEVKLEIGERYTEGWETIFSGLDFQEDEIRLLRRPDGGQAIWSQGSLTLISEAVPSSIDSVDLSGDSFVISSRTEAAKKRYQEGFSGPNIWVLDRSGVLQSSFSAGSGFNSVVTDGDNNIWVGYRDEGDWPNSAQTPFSVVDSSPEYYPSPGVVRWDKAGLCRWVLAADDASQETLFHCYSINSGKFGTVAAMDHENSLVQVSINGVGRIYRSPVQAPRGLAFDGSAVMFLGRYEAMKRGDSVKGFDVLTFATIEAGALRISIIGKAVMPDGDPFPAAPRGVSSRGRSILMNFGDPALTYRLRIPWPSV